MLWYATASLAPVLLLAAACARGGAWAFGALALVTLVVHGLDRWTRGGPALREDAGAARAGRVLNWGLAVAHLAILPWGASGDWPRGRTPGQ